MESGNASPASTLTMQDHVQRLKVLRDLEQQFLAGEAGATADLYSANKDVIVEGLTYPFLGVRKAVGSVVTAVVKKSSSKDLALSLYAAIKESIEQNMVRGDEEDKADEAGETKEESSLGEGTTKQTTLAHDTEGWKALETSLETLNLMFQALVSQDALLSFLDSERSAELKELLTQCSR